METQTTQEKALSAETALALMEQAVQNLRAAAIAYKAASHVAHKATSPSFRTSKATKAQAAADWNAWLRLNSQVSGFPSIGENIKEML